MGAESARTFARNASIVVLVRDEAVREVVATALSELSRLLVFQTGDVAAAREALMNEPAALLLGPDFRDTEIERLLDDLDDASIGIVLLVSDRVAGALALRHDVVALGAPFDLERLTDAIDAAKERRVGARSGRRPKL
jgi:hypothetical protein